MNFRAFKKFEFESRIFFSLTIVTVLVLLSAFLFKGDPTNMQIIGHWIGLSEETSVRTGFYLIAAIILLASLLRMWAGSILSSDTVMSFRIQKSVLHLSGPYVLSRNPIYLADLIAFGAFTLALKPIGLLMPVLIYVHYLQLISYEEENLRNKFPGQYHEYIQSASRFLPRFRNLKRFRAVDSRFFLNWDGFRYNAQYVLFIPGMIVSAYTGKLWHGILIGLPAVVDWAVLHTIKGLAPARKERKMSEINDQ